MRDLGERAQTSEEELDTFEEVDEPLVTRYDIVHGLGVGRQPNVIRDPKETYPEKNTDSGKDYIRG